MDPARPRRPAAAPEADHARLLLDLVATREDRDPEIPLAPDGRPGAARRSPPSSPPRRPSASPRESRTSIRGAGLAGASATPPPTRSWRTGPRSCGAGLGKDFALLSGFLDYKAEFYADAIDELKPLADDAAYAARRPAVLYYLGRAYYANANYGKAVDALERYIRSQTLLGRELLPASEGG